jgi:hypothetical protein
LYQISNGGFVVFHSEFSLEIIGGTEEDSILLFYSMNHPDFAIRSRINKTREYILKIGIIRYFEAVILSYLIAGILDGKSIIVAC